jgi:NAD(P)H-dependent FMN reductase
MALRLLVFYGSYRQGRLGIRLADFLVNGLRNLGHDVELIDAKAVGLPMLDRRFKDYPRDGAPESMQALATKIAAADGFVFVAGEYNWGQQPGLKNLVDHFLDEFSRRPAAIASYSAGRLAGAHASVAWHATLTSMGMVVSPNSLAVGSIAAALDERAEPLEGAGAALTKAFAGFADELRWWAEAAKAQRGRTSST